MRDSYIVVNILCGHSTSEDNLIIVTVIYDQDTSWFDHGAEVGDGPFLVPLVSFEVG